ncbi:MAG TPA: hypothetical protein VF192_00950 [Longimicrobiales bacterium]
MSARGKGPRRRPKGGLVGQALKAARAMDAARERDRDEEAARIAERVYATAIQVRGDTTYPLRVFAPLVAAAEEAAIGILIANEMRMTQESVAEVAGYLASGFINMTVGFNPAHFEEWRSGRLREKQEEVDGAAHAGPWEGEGGPVAEGASLEGTESGADQPRGGAGGSGARERGRDGGDASPAEGRPADGGEGDRSGGDPDPEAGP